MNKRKKGNNYWKNKKANLFDLPFILILLLIISSFILITFFVYNKIEGSLLGSPSFNKTTDSTGNYTTSILQHSRAGFLSFDKLFFYAFLSMTLFTIVSAYFIPSHPGFFIFGVVMMILVISMAAVISNSYNALENANSDINASAQLFPLMHYIMNNLPWIIMAFGFIILIVLVIKPGVMSSGGV